MSSSYPQLTQSQQHAYAMKVQRAWHYDGYSEAQQRAIVERVRRLIERAPGSYLAKHWREVYR